MIRFTRRFLPLAALASPLFAEAQQPASTDTTARPTSTISVPIELSGVLYPQFIYGGAKGARSNNRFELERAYLNARAKISDRASIRVTTDVFRPAPTASYTIRAKYAYAQYDYWTKGEGLLGANGQVRLGMQQTVIVEQIEQFWPRWIARTGVERIGYFSSSDLGASTTLSLGGGATELFAMVANGNGYTTPESDRFKDYSARISLAPFGLPSSAAGGLVVSPWIYKGARPSALQPSDARKLDRMGVFAGWRMPAMAIGAHVARATTEREEPITGGGLRIAEESSQFLNAFAHVKPFRLVSPTGSTAFGLIVRWDAIDGDDRYPSPGGEFTARDGRFVVAGITHELSRRLQWALDFQQQSPRGDPALAGQDSRTYNVHVSAAF